MNKRSLQDTKAFEQLLQWNLRHANTSMRELFTRDPQRFEKYHVAWKDFLFDYSKNRHDAESMRYLLDLAEGMQLSSGIEAMFSGEKINRTENRPVLHTALRNFSNSPVLADGVDVMPEIRAVQEKMRFFSQDIIDGKLKGFDGQPFTDVVNIGIGGSDLGPLMVCEALKHYAVPHIKVHFVSNVDGTHLAETLKHLNPATTLFLVASKTFTTQETMANAQSARRWFLNAAKDEKWIAHHFAALSAATAEVEKFGIDPERMFPFWDWVGGRYSLWSAIGLSICIAIGYNQFEQLLKGAFEADEHFRTASFNENIPVLMALIGIFNINILGFKTQAVIPYDQYMHRFTAYLQQADMESNGKYVNKEGLKIDYATGPVIWGEPGTNGQHAFFQLIHQGTQIVPCDFIAPANSLNPVDDHHHLLMSNFFAQTEALMKGKTAEEVQRELTEKGLPEDAISWHTPFRVFEGNRPSNSLLIKKISPFNLGSLIAFYEHKIFVQGFLWNIFSFDQWGVELGKKLAQKILPELKSDEQVAQHDSSTNGLINQFKMWNKE